MSKTASGAIGEVPTPLVLVFEDVGLGLLGLSGFFGGELVLRHLIGPHT